MLTEPDQLWASDLGGAGPGSKASGCGGSRAHRDSPGLSADELLAHRGQRAGPPPGTPGRASPGRTSDVMADSGNNQEETTQMRFSQVHRRVTSISHGRCDGGEHVLQSGPRTLLRGFTWLPGEDPLAPIRPDLSTAGSPCGSLRSGTGRVWVSGTPVTPCAKGHGCRDGPRYKKKAFTQEPGWQLGQGNRAC